MGRETLGSFERRLISQHSGIWGYPLAVIALASFTMQVDALLLLSTVMT